MDLGSLKPAEGSRNRAGKRLGRGEGSGKGGTAARGHNPRYGFAQNMSAMLLCSPRTREQ